MWSERVRYTWIFLLGLCLGTGAVAQSAAQPGRAPDPAREPTCRSFARHAVQWREAAEKQRCDVAALRRAKVLLKTETQLYQSCMQVPAEIYRRRHPQALGFKQALESGCSAQLGRPISLGSP